MAHIVSAKYKEESRHAAAWRRKMNAHEAARRGGESGVAKHGVAATSGEKKGKPPSIKQCDNNNDNIMFMQAGDNAGDVDAGMAAQMRITVTLHGVSVSA